MLRQYVIQLLHRELPGLPPWLVEGIAGYYDSFEVFGIEPGDIADVLTEAARADEIRYFSIDVSALDPVPVTSRPLTAPELDLALGQLLFELGEERWPEAEPRLARAVAATESLPVGVGAAGAWARLARIDQARGDLDAADTRLARAEELAPDEAAYLTLRADLLMARLGDARPTDAVGEARLAEARSLLLRATQLDPGVGETWARLGRAGLRELGARIERERNGQ